MDEESISLGLGFQMFDQGNPTPLGLLAMILSLAGLLVSVKVVSEFFDDTNNPLVSMEVQYVQNGQTITGEIQIELYEDEAPMHVESFLTHVENGAYVGIEFHRVISEFMIQGGDIESMGDLGDMQHTTMAGAMASKCPSHNVLTRRTTRYPRNMRTV